MLFHKSQIDEMNHILKVIVQNPELKTSEQLSTIIAAIPNITQELYNGRSITRYFHAFIKASLLIPELKEKLVHELTPHIPLILDGIASGGISGRGSGWGGYRKLLLTIAQVPEWAKAATDNVTQNIPKSLSEQNGRWHNVRRDLEISSMVPAWKRATESPIAKILPEILKDYKVKARGGIYNPTINVEGSLKHTLSAIYKVPAWRKTIETASLPKPKRTTKKPSKAQTVLEGFQARLA